jgi:biopolymer transport protein ExbD
MKTRRRHASTVELQIGPMVDMIFLLLIFFMVQAQLSSERELGLRPPGAAAASVTPDGRRIEIRADGQVVLDGQPVDGRAGRELPVLAERLRAFRAACDRARSPALATLAPDDAATHQRIVDVLNACAEAGLAGVTFAGTENTGLADAGAR